MLADHQWLLVVLRPHQLTPRSNRRFQPPPLSHFRLLLRGGALGLPSISRASSFGFSLCFSLSLLLSHSRLHRGRRPKAKRLLASQKIQNCCKHLAVVFFIFLKYVKLPKYPCVYIFQLTFILVSKKDWRKYFNYKGILIITLNKDKNKK